jgi:hypothetical protein
MLRLKRSGQSTAEYAIVIGLVIAAAVAMQIYVKRGLQSKVKSAVDYVDANATTILGATGESQYEPYYLSSNMTSTRGTTGGETVAEGGGVTRTTTADTSSRTGTQIMLNTTAGQ